MDSAFIFAMARSLGVQGVWSLTGRSGGLRGQQLGCPRLPVTAPHKKLADKAKEAITQYARSRGFYVHLYAFSALHGYLQNRVPIRFSVNPRSQSTM